MADTFLLDRAAWDVCLEVSGNIAVASAPYAQIQDASSAARMFEGEQWFDTSIGVPYMTQILGAVQPLPVLRERVSREVVAAVPGVSSAIVAISDIRERSLSGQVQITTANGQEVAIL